MYADIYPGDYWAFSNIPYTYLDENDEEQESTYSGTMRAADFDYLYKCSDALISAHHVGVVPDAPMFDAPMNDTDTTEGGYVGSKMRTVYLRRAEAIFKACFGENHVLKHREYLVNAVRDGMALGGAWCDSLVELMDERMVYGSLICDSAIGNMGMNKDSMSMSQLNLFRYRPDMIGNRHYVWLRNVGSAKHFSRIQIAGFSSMQVASTFHGVRPYALIY